MARAFNFSAGPGILPEPVLVQAASEMLDYKGSGMSVMEMSHRSKWYEDIQNRAENTLREVMDIPANYRVLFLQGGAHLQFSMIPLNLRRSGKADFWITGNWSEKAIAEAKKYISVQAVATGKSGGFRSIPEVDVSLLSPDADYFHLTTNNTVCGTRIRGCDIPDTGSVPVVADMSSNILSEVYDVRKFGLIYAGAQKNMGPAGVTVVIIRDDLVGKTEPWVPTMLQYSIHAENKSLYNTPPCYAIYICGLVFEWVRTAGGVAFIQQANEEKAALLYGAIDHSALYTGLVEKKDRSLMNVTFTTGNEDLDKKFAREAESKGMTNLKGYRSMGGMRASIYNAMPRAGVESLVDFMKVFETDNA